MVKKYNLIIWHGDEMYETRFSYLSKGHCGMPVLKHSFELKDLKTKEAKWTEKEIDRFLQLDDFKDYEKVVRASMVEIGEKIK